MGGKEKNLEKIIDALEKTVMFQKGRVLEILKAKEESDSRLQDLQTLLISVQNKNRRLQDELVKERLTMLNLQESIKHQNEVQNCKSNLPPVSRCEKFVSHFSFKKIYNHVFKCGGIFIFIVFCIFL